jgi:hypothetical protein
MEMQRMRALFVLLVIVEVLLGIALFMPVLIDRKDLARAVVVHRQGPNAETASELHRIQGEVAQERLWIKVGTAFAFALNSVALVRVERRIRERSGLSTTKTTT